MNEDISIIEGKIVYEYFSILKENFIPNTKEVRDKVRYALDVGCFDLTHNKELLDRLNEDMVHNTLERYKHIHYHFGQLYYDAQNPLLVEWIYKQLMLT